MTRDDKSKVQDSLRGMNQVIGAEIKTTREALKLRQTEMAGVLGLDQSALSRIETGLQTITAAQWVAFCDYTHRTDTLTELVKGGAANECE